MRNYVQVSIMFIAVVCYCDALVCFGVYDVVAASDECSWLFGMGAL